MRPQRAALGEPTRIVALVRQGRLEQRRRGDVRRGRRPPNSWLGQLRGIDRVQKAGPGHRRFRTWPVIECRLDAGHAPPMRVRRPRAMGGSACSAVTARFSSCGSRAFGASAWIRAPSPCESHVGPRCWPGCAAGGVWRRRRSPTARRALGESGRGCLGSCGLFDALGAAGSRARRDWLRRQGEGTVRFFRVGSPQRCKSGAGRHHNWELLLAG